jgi:hypothetical protein
LKTYLVEVFDNRDQYGGGMPCLQFEATSRREAYETIFESMGMNINIKEVKANAFTHNVLVAMEGSRS